MPALFRRLPLAVRYGAVGFVVGVLFPLAGLLQASIMLWGDMSLGHLLSTQRRVPLLRVILRRKPSLDTLKASIFRK